MRVRYAKVYTNMLDRRLTKAVLRTFAERTGPSLRTHLDVMLSQIAHQSVQEAVHCSLGRAVCRKRSPDKNNTFPEDNTQKKWFVAKMIMMFVKNAVAWNRRRS